MSIVNQIQIAQRNSAEDAIIANLKRMGMMDFKQEHPQDKPLSHTDRSDAVNLARNLKSNPLGKPTDKGIAMLLDAILVMDAALTEIANKGDVVVSRNQDGAIIGVTRQVEDGKILSVIAESNSKKERSVVAESFDYQSINTQSDYSEGRFFG